MAEPDDISGVAYDSLCICELPTIAFKMYPFLGDDEWCVSFDSTMPQVWPPWWRRMVQRWLLGWRWVKV